jgi:hypothetical protein
MSEELAVLEQKPLMVAPVHKTRAAICAQIKIQDDPSKSISAVIKDYLKSRGLKGADLQAEYNRILREDTAPIAAAKVGDAIAKGWLQEIRTYNLDKKTGEETKFAIIYSAPKVPKVKALSVSQQEKILSLLGKDSAMARQMMELLAKNKMAANVKVRDVETVTTPEPTEPTPEPTEPTASK